MSRNKMNYNISFECALVSLIMLILCFDQCTPADKKEESPSKINTAHLDALYEEKKMGHETIGYVSIYSEFPDYGHTGDADEGIACVDDASRAAIFYLRQYKHTSSRIHLNKAKNLLSFIASMQAPNGYFYNFIQQDGSINTNGKTSIANPGWWSWRALWAFGEAIEVLEVKDPLVKELNERRDVLVRNILRERSTHRMETDTAGGMTIPTWLPGDGAAADQAAVMLTGLALMYGQQDSVKSNVAKDSISYIMHRMADGIMMMQVKEPDSVYSGAFLSWENLWHAYGNIQSYALLSAGQVLHDTTLIQSALYEIDHFYPSAMASGGLSHFWVKKEGNKTIRYDTHKLPQIAYGYRVMIWACVKAFEITGEEKYYMQAVELASWFDGKNFANQPMYDPATGLGFDGIDESLKVNRNSGAESTIESLLSLQSLELAASK